MAWTSLQNSLGSKPRVLAGPILRKVTPRTVTVWVALRVGGTVVLSVRDDQNEVRMLMPRRTVSIGRNLHIVAVTAIAAGELTEDIVYRYDLSFLFDDGLTMDLATATNRVDLGYPPHSLPSFALPPKDPNLLRLIQGSCRMPHAEGKDTLPLVDDLIAQTASNAFARPHQLLLTGDQIYADDVGASMLVMLSDAADALLDWKEVFPAPASHGGPGPLAASKLSPFLRRSVLADAGFTSEDLDAHLMSLGEYLCMYLFVWSDAVWPPTITVQGITSGLPLFEDVVANVKTNIHPSVVSLWERFLNRERKLIESDTKAVAEFSQGLSKVRRALANIPSYMIFDDHEVTDDWNMTRNFCRNVYGKPLGQRIARNALVAYALCQHWGNAPEQFADATPAPPGLDLLRLLDTPDPTVANAFDQKAASLDQHSRSITALLGLHDDTVLAGRPHAGLFHDSHSLQYHYTVEGPGHQVIFTDTRTWRSFPDGGNEPSELLPIDQFKRQILNTPDLITPLTPDRVLLVVVSTNAPPVGPIRSAARHAGVARAVKHEPDVYEAWEIPSVPFDRLLKTLTDKLPLDPSGQRYGPVILLSGDVHTSFASRLVYRAKVRFEDVLPQPATAVFAQLVASSLKKQTEDTVGFHRVGYRYSPRIARTLGFIPLHRPEGYIGWNTTPGSGLFVGQKVTHGLSGNPRPWGDIKLTQPTIPLQEENPRKTGLEFHLSLPPDYRYRLDYLIASREGFQPTRPGPISLPPTGSMPEQRKEAAKAFNKAHAHYRYYNSGIESKQAVVGVNNFGEITFKWGTGDDKKVNHTLRWYDVKLPPLVTWATYTVSLNPNDADSSGKLNFPDIKAAKGDP